MLFNSIEFLLFFPIVIICYYILPNKIKNIWLLVASYYFYMGWNAEHAVLIFFSTVVTYLTGLILEKIKNSDWERERQKTYKRFTLIGCLVINLSILFYFKYFIFSISILYSVMNKIGITIGVPDYDIILPVGISFYTFQALGYIIDVYRDNIYAEKNFFEYALFVSFFPQLVAGPIERSKNLLKQLSVTHKFDFNMAREGLLLMLWGYFLKIVLADRIAIFVNTVYGDYTSYPGYYLVVATILFSVQIYCDFAGYSTIAVGGAKFLGINLIENFDAPYISTSVAEFWRKWHISLTSWFTDYLYIPLGGNRKGKARKYLNKLIVFLVSGLWHGASVSFIIWGGLNGIYQIVGEFLMPLRDKLVKLFRLNRESLAHKVASAIGTFILIDFSWIFFRAETMTHAINIIKSMINVRNPWIMFDDSLYSCGLDEKNFEIMLIGILVLWVVDICKSKGIVIHKLLIKQDYWCRWLVIDVAIIVLLVFGVWGATYDASSFIYFQF